MKKADAAVFLLFGQSNAVGHNLPMAEEDKILQPLKNVFGLSRSLNQSFETERLQWTGYTSHDMNLAETQDHTYSVANCLAALWQTEVDRGADLPDLYIIQIAIGAQGITEQFMWYPDREKKLIPGLLGTVDISMYPLAQHVLSLLEDSFRTLGKTYEIMGLHWLGGAEEMILPMEVLSPVLDDLYRRFFRDMRAAAGRDFPIALYKLEYPDRAMDLDPSGNYLKQMYFINATFEYLSRTCEHVHIFDNRQIPFYDPHIRGNGLYQACDVVHHTQKTNCWIARWILEQYSACQRSKTDSR